MNWIPLASAASTPAPAPLVIQDTRVSSQQIDVTLAGNLNIGSIFNGSVTAGEVGYWLDAMAYADQYEQTQQADGTILGSRFGYGLRIMFRVRQISPKASLNYGLIGASVDAGFVQASYEIDAFGFGPQTATALASILDGVAAQGPSLTGDVFYQLNESILKNLVTYITTNQATMQPVRVATLVSSNQSGDSLGTSHAVLYAMRQLNSGKSLQDALNSAGDYDANAIRLAYASIMGNTAPNVPPTGLNTNAASQWLADN